MRNSAGLDSYPRGYFDMPSRKAKNTVTVDYGDDTTDFNHDDLIGNQDTAKSRQRKDEPTVSRFIISFKLDLFVLLPGHFANILPLQKCARTSHDDDELDPSAPLHR